MPLIKAMKSQKKNFSMTLCPIPKFPWPGTPPHTLPQGSYVTVHKCSLAKEWTQNLTHTTSSCQIPRETTRESRTLEAGNSTLDTHKLLHMAGLSRDNNALFQAHFANCTCYNYTITIMLTAEKEYKTQQSSYFLNAIKLSMVHKWCRMVKI